MCSVIFSGMYMGMGVLMLLSLVLFIALCAVGIWALVKTLRNRPI